MATVVESSTAVRPRWANAQRLARRVVREPLLHFLIMGAVIFAGVSGVRALQRPTVRIDAQDVNQLVEYWQLQSQRPPDKAELAAIIQERVDEELLAREAQRLGMDKGDLIIRRRLAQKMAFASEDLGDRQPTEVDLKADYERTKAQYAAPARIAFRQVFFSTDRGEAAAQAAASAALGAARSGRSDLGGDPFMLPLTYADADPSVLTRDYGGDFAKQVSAAPPGQWIGPLRTPFGFHIVEVESRSAPEVPPYATVRDQVLQNDLAARRQEKNQVFLQALRRKYRVEIAGVSP